jgi:hypothetical protein
MKRKELPDHYCKGIHIKQKGVVMESSNYRIAFDTAMARVRKKDPVVMADNAGVEYLADMQMFMVPFFQHICIVNCVTGEVSDKDTGRRIDLCTGVIVLDYLSCAQDVSVDERLISLKEVPNGGMIFYPAFKLRTIDALVRTFQQKVEDLHDAASHFGGISVKMGHAASKFQALPKISITVVLWAGDEEINASGNVLFDNSIDAFLPVEDIIGLGNYCVDELLHYHAQA